MESLAANVLDMQVFITRSPGREPLIHEGIPSFIITDAGRYQPRTPRSPSTPYTQGVEPSASDMAYVAIANSDAVEGVGFPFPPNKVLDMVQRLSYNQALLVECMEFGSRLFNYAIHGSIRDLYRKLYNTTEPEKKI